MFYTSDELMALRAELAVGNSQVDRLSLRYNPWDLADIWVLNPIDNGYIKATAEHLLSLAAGRNAIREVVEEALRKPSRRRRARAARFLSKPALQPTNEDESSSAPTPSPLPQNDSERQPDPTDDGRNESAPNINPDDIDVDDWDVTST